MKIMGIHMCEGGYEGMRLGMNFIHIPVHSKHKLTGSILIPIHIYFKYDVWDWSFSSSFQPKTYVIPNNPSISILAIVFFFVLMS